MRRKWTRLVRSNARGMSMPVIAELKNCSSAVTVTFNVQHSIFTRRSSASEYRCRWLFKKLDTCGVPDIVVSFALPKPSRLRKGVHPGGRTRSSRIVSYQQTTNRESAVNWEATGLHGDLLGEASESILGGNQLLDVFTPLQ